MAGLTPKLPIAIDSDDGIMLIKTYRDLAIQNLKNVLLTSPGEKIMDPEFGVGLRRYLFQPNHETTYLDIESRIQNQVSKYLSFIKILGITFSSPNAPDDSLKSRRSSVMEGNFLGIEIEFKIIPLGLKETLNLP
jgi:phage baseplate assembly protein W